MDKYLFELHDFSVSSIENETNKIVKEISIKVNKGEIHAIMGPNGSGKTTLSYAIAGHPFYKANGKICFENESIINYSPEERAKKGIFLSFQNPPFIEGVSLLQLLKKSYFEKYNLKENDIKSYEIFRKKLDESMNMLALNDGHLKRDSIKNFSGGERKKAEALQITMLKPKLIILDEIDSGLDVDSLKLIAKTVKNIVNEGSSVIAITHYARILNYLNPDFVHIMKNGRIVKTGKSNLAKEIEKTGYNNI